MSSSRALALCRAGIFIEPDFRKYRAVSELIHQEFYRLTPLVESVSIDEAYLDVSAICPSLEDAKTTAMMLQKNIFNAIGLTASAGVSFNKFLAKTASDYQKPAGLTLITPENAASFIDDLPIEKFYGLGKVSVKKLHRINVRNGRDLKKLSPSILKVLFGKAGAFYYGIVRGIDDRPVELEGDPKSISREITLPNDSSSLREIRILLRMLARKVARRAAKKGFVGNSITIKLKFADFQTITRSMTVNSPTGDGPEIGNYAVSLLDKVKINNLQVRLVGVGISQLSPACAPKETQLLFDF
jgi:DNA polymerase-4